MIDLACAPKQRPERIVIDAPLSDPIDAFLKRLAGHGLEPPGPIIADGLIHRFDTEKRGDLAGWYVYYCGEICAGAYGDWRTGLNETWSHKDRSEMSDDESRRYKEAILEAQEARKAAEKANHEAAQRRAHAIWGAAGPADTNHPYLKKKGVKCDYIRQSGQDIIIPMLDEDGVLHNVQRIGGSGNRKRFLFGGRVAGLSFTIPGESGKGCYICEGFSTGATIRDATGRTVVCAFNAGNLPKVAAVVRDKMPHAQITICADNDRFTPGNPGITKAKEAAKVAAAQIIWPVFDGLPGGDNPDRKLSDFNDLASVGGLDLVAEQISGGPPGEKNALPPPMPEHTKLAGRLLKRPPPLEFVLNCGDMGMIPKGIIGAVTATGGVGKTFFLLSLAIAAAGGQAFGPIRPAIPVETLLVIGEDDQLEMERRLWDISGGVFPEKLHALSVYGELGPIMRLEGQEPVLADTYYWLDQAIQNHDNLKLLIIDPKSRFYGLDENSADHSTRWIQALESLSKRHGVTILFSHHTNKDGAGGISQNMSRGSSAIVDGCRWQGGLCGMDEDTAGRLGIDEPRQYVLFDAPKSNYSSSLPAGLCFRRGDNGVLKYVDPGRDHVEHMAEELAEMLRLDTKRYTLRELTERAEGKGIADEMAQIFEGFKRKRDMSRAASCLLKKGIFVEKFTGNKRSVLMPMEG